MKLCCWNICDNIIAGQKCDFYYNISFIFIELWLLVNGFFGLFRIKKFLFIIMYLNVKIETYFVRNGICGHATRSWNVPYNVNPVLFTQLKCID